MLAWINTVTMAKGFLFILGGRGEEMQIKESHRKLPILGLSYQEEIQQASSIKKIQRNSSIYSKKKKKKNNFQSPYLQR